MAQSLRNNSHRIALALIAIFMAPTGFQAALFPRSFYDDFPLGRGWIAMTQEPYSEHLVRDVGGLFLALVVASAWVAWRNLDSRPLAAAWLIQGILHVVYHLDHLDHFEGVDKVGLIMTLGSIPVLAAVALVVPRPNTP
jgi:hypothetical protein